VAAPLAASAWVVALALRWGTEQRSSPEEGCLPEELAGEGLVRAAAMAAVEDDDEKAMAVCYDKNR